MVKATKARRIRCKFFRIQIRQIVQRSFRKAKRLYHYLMLLVRQGSVFILNTQTDICIYRPEDLRPRVILSLLTLRHGPMAGFRSQQQRTDWRNRYWFEQLKYVVLYKIDSYIYCWLDIDHNGTLLKVISSESASRRPRREGGGGEFSASFRSLVTTADSVWTASMDRCNAGCRCADREWQ